MLRDAFRACQGGRAARRRAARLALIAGIGWIASALVATGAVKEALDRVVETYESHDFKLLVDLHEPALGGEQVAYLDERGWHHDDAGRPVVLRAGEMVTVTGVFNYAEKGVFLEITRQTGGKGGATRARVRVRFMAAAGPDKPEDQATQILALIRRVLQ